jgi:hypothetical protein
MYGDKKMNESVLNTVLLSVQIFLALFFVAAAIPKLTGRGLQQWAAFDDLPRAEIVFIGAMELLGAFGLVLPMALGILTWLTPLSAIGLAVNVLMAAGFHVRADERLNAVETVLWASIATLIAIGRWDLVPSHISIPPAFVVLALAVLVPSAIINVVVLLKRQASRTVPSS